MPDIESRVPVPGFLRTKTIDVVPLGDLSFQVTARLTDVSRWGDHSTADEGVPDTAASRVVHDVVVTARVQGPELEVVELGVETRTVPYVTCPFVVPLAQRLVGRRLTSAWRKSVLDVYAGTRGCTHVNTLLLGLSEVQTMVFYLRMNEQVPYTTESRANGQWIAAGLDLAPQLADVCFSLRSDGPVLARAEDVNRRGR